MTITVNGRPQQWGMNYGRDWEWTLSFFDLALSVDDRPVEASLTYRAVRGSQGTAGSTRTELVEADYTQTVEFASLGTKLMVLRHYWIARRHGAPPIIARWMVDQQCQRHISRTMNDDASVGWAHLHAWFKDTREDFEVESDNADEALRLLNDSTTGGFWEWEDGELWLIEDRCAEYGVRGTQCVLDVGHFGDCEFE